MKKSLLAVALAASTAIAAAQTDTVTFTKVLDTTTAGVGSGSVYSATYVPVDGKFISSRGGMSINIFNAQTGAYETDMSLNGITPSGLGFFGLTASKDGVIYGMEAGGSDIWRWAGTTDTDADKTYDSADFARVGYTGTVGTSVTIAFTGSAGSGYGDVQFFSDTFPFSSSSFAFNETVNLKSKSAIAINNEGTVAFVVGDSGPTALQKWVKADGTWGSAPVWMLGTLPPEGQPSGTGFWAGPMAYDNEHDILLVAPAPGSTKKLLAIAGADGAQIGEIDLDNALATTGGYAGGFVETTETGGTVYLIGRSADDAGSSVMYVYDYVVEGASVNDWSLYQQ